MPSARMKLQHIEAFRAVVRTGSMTKAAQQLRTSQPQISRLIFQLEQITKFSLFVRRGTRIVTSVEGAKFFEEVERSFVGLSRLEAAAANIREFKAEHLHVAAMPRLAGGILTQIVAELKAEQPDVMVSIHSGTASTVHSWVSSGTCDVGLAMLYGGGTSGVDIEPVMRTKCVCILPPGHRLAKLDRIAAGDLAGENFITFSAGSSLRTQTDAFFRKADVEPRIVAETDLGASACKLVSSGIGVSLINPMAALEESHNEDLIVRPINPDIIVTLALLFPPFRLRTRLTEIFEGHARRRIHQQFGMYSLDAT
jgi:DNA-binding transcriptional LysR family regulator